MIVICSFALVRVRLRRSSSLFHISTDLYFMAGVDILCISVLTIATKALWFIAENVASMQMLSVQFFEISHKERGFFLEIRPPGVHFGVM